MIDNLMLLLNAASSSASSSGSKSGLGSMGMIIWIVVLVVVIWLFMFRPQSKQNKQRQALMASMAIGDTVLTTSGFYGTIIDISGDTVIVEFGNNKNCRIPMTKSAIQDIEKPQDAVAADNNDDKKDDKKEDK